MSASQWDRRIARAEKLACSSAAAAELLRFYAEIARFQKKVYESLRPVKQSDLKTTLLEPHFAPVLSLIRRIGPPMLIEVAEELARNRNTLADLLADREPAGEIEKFFERVLMQPYTENLARHSRVDVDNSPPNCPFCGEKPQVAVLREEGESGKRSLICSLCSTEWSFRRLLCPGCGEEAADKLPVYTAAEFDYIRVEACESCGRFIKCVDLTRNGLAAPAVDELASVALTIWAEQKGYRKLQPNLLGV